MLILSYFLYFMDVCVSGLHSLDCPIGVMVTFYGYLDNKSC